jgi:hypothetical protein
MKNDITPTGDYCRMMYDNGPVRPQTARLFRAEGSWWLRYEDGWESNTHYAAGRPNGCNKAEMTRTVTTTTGATP